MENAKNNKETSGKLSPSEWKFNIYSNYNLYIFTFNFWNKKLFNMNKYK